MTKNRKSHGGICWLRELPNLDISRQRARPLPVQVDPVQADVGATKWVAPSGLPHPVFLLDETATIGTRAGVAKAAGGARIHGSQAPAGTAEGRKG